MSGIGNSGNGPTVLLLTDDSHPELNNDDLPLAAAFRDAGWQVRPTIWSQEIPDADLALIRSTWDYAGRHTEYLDVIESVAARMPLRNPAATVRWNIDKSYLDQLDRSGVPVPATKVVRRGSGRTLAAILADLDCDEVVAKPLIGAGGYRTIRLGRGTEDAWQSATGREDLLVQEFIPEVITGGEWSLMYFGGEYSHAVLKRPSEGEFRVQPQHGGGAAANNPDSGLLAAAERVIAAIDHPWTYARIDGVVSRRGFLLMEIELIEPHLFFGEAPGAAQRLVQLCSESRGATLV